MVLALELGLVLFLILLNGFLAMAELAIVSSRRTRLQVMAEAEQPGAQTALRLSEDPGRFLSTVQIGITLIGVLAGAYSGATIAERLAGWVESLGVSPSASEAIGVAVVVPAVTYLSLIFGELVPKRIALNSPERIAASVAGPMQVIAKLSSPLVSLLDASSRLVLLVFGLRRRSEARVTEEEIKAMIAEAETAGVVEPAETAMIAGVMRLGDRPVRAMMTPRPDIDWIDLEAAPEEIRTALRQTRHSRLPVARGSIDSVEGIVRTKDLLDAVLDGRDLNVQSVIREVPVVHDGLDALDAVDVLKGSDVHFALVVDEYGSFQGVVTTADILETIAGEFHEPGVTDDEPSIIRRGDGSYLLDGALPVDEMSDLLRLMLPAARDFHTVAGFMLAELRHVPQTGEQVVFRNWRFEVIDMDGRRIDKVLATPLPAPLPVPRRA